MKNQLRKLNQGFTIIEVLIVLAIAGLILAIVFLAVPALQRNSRNTSIRSDSASVLAGVNDYVANNNGALPAASGAQAGPTINIGAGAAAAEAKVRGSTTVTIIAAGCGGAAPALGNINIRTGCKCNPAGTASVAAARAVTAEFLIEPNSGAPAPQCIES